MEQNLKCIEDFGIELEHLGETTIKRGTLVTYDNKLINRPIIPASSTALTNTRLRALNELFKENPTKFYNKFEVVGSNGNDFRYVMTSRDTEIDKQYTAKEHDIGTLVMTELSGYCEINDISMEEFPYIQMIDMLRRYEPTPKTNYMFGINLGDYVWTKEIID